MEAEVNGGGPSQSPSERPAPYSAEEKPMSGGALGSKNGQAKLNEDKVREIRSLWDKGLRATALSKRFGVSINAINNAATGITWGHVA